MTLKALTARDIETLEELVRVVDEWKKMEIDRWLAPLDIGGSNGSHHSATLHKLSARGLCDMKKWGRQRDKGSCRYWSNEAGIAHLRDHTDYFQRRAEREKRLAEIGDRI